MISFVLAFVIWSLLAYINHWFVHTKYAPKWLAEVHQLHHDKTYPMKKNFDWRTLLFWFGSWRETFGVLAGITMPCIVAAVITNCWWILLLHYVYESLFSDNLIEHNQKVKGKIADFFGVGNYHVKHHVDPTVNFAVGMSLWDKLFKTKGVTNE